MFSTNLSSRMFTQSNPWLRRGCLSILRNRRIVGSCVCGLRYKGSSRQLSIRDPHCYTIRLGCSHHRWYVHLTRITKMVASQR